jgi:hypothetical protein
MNDRRINVSAETVPDRSVAADTSDEPWHALREELDCWHGTGRVPTLWWRDDDATRPHAALERLLDLSLRHGVPIGVAVVPATMESGLLPVMQACAGAQVLQHGYAHVDHAARDEPGAELGGHRPGMQVLAELEQGFAVLSSRFQEQFIPVLVPPWNRIDQGLVPELTRLGFQGLSGYSPRERRATAQGLVCSNCHVDPINWRAGGVFKGAGKCLAALVEHLSARRLGKVDDEEPTGLLTHHLQHDEPLWEFLDELFPRLGNESVRWLRADQVFER